MMTKKPDQFGEQLQRAQAQVTPQRRTTARKSLTKSALEMGSTGDEVLKNVLADSSEDIQVPKEKKRPGFFGNLLSLIGIIGPAAPHIK